jgi:hypothetical protein
MTKPGPEWLLFIATLPPKPDYLRVKLQRRVRRLGAVGLKGAVYLLPMSAETMAGFRSLRKEIVAEGGEATVCAARFIEGIADTDVVAIFNRDRKVEYQEFVVACRELEARWQPDAGRHLNEPALVAERGRLERRLGEILGRDYFAAAQREDALQAIEKLAVLDIAETSTN